MYKDQAAILKRVSDRKGTVKDLAAKLDLSRQWLERATRGEVALGAETCVEIALEYGESALLLLRAAGKGKLADLLERAGLGNDGVSATDHDLLLDLRSLPETQQRPIRALIRSLSARGGSPQRKSPTRS